MYIQVVCCLGDNYDVDVVHCVVCGHEVTWHWHDVIALSDVRRMATKIVLYAFILQVNVTLKKAGSKMEHQGIKIEFIGQIGKVKLGSR